MVAKLRLFAGFVVMAAATALALPPAAAQTPPTVASVGADLQVFCVAGANGLVADEAACLSAVARALSTANAHAALGQVGPQVDIGALVGQIMVNFPALAQQVIDLVNSSGNAAVALGVSNSLGPNWVGPRPIVSPA